MLPIIIIAVILVLIGIFLILDFKKKNQQLDEELEKSNEKNKNLEDELQQLKIENLRFALNPHSFRNTLNSIEHLAKKTFESVNSLSGIFDYMLYDATNQFVTLRQEINFAEAYLKLYRLHLKPTANVKFSIDERLEDKIIDTKMVAPLICAHFIENAFKHGDLESDDAFITIQLELLNDKEIIYSVRNRISQTKSMSKGGIGEETFQERLDLLYKDKYHLDYNTDDTVFTANLKLNLYDS